MSEPGEALAANRSTIRNVTMEITNFTDGFCLVNPEFYLNAGKCQIAPPPCVAPLKSAVCNFSRFTDTSGLLMMAGAVGGMNSSAAASQVMVAATREPTGTAGVLTYDLLEGRSNGVREKMAVMFSVPFDYNLYGNWLALAVYGRNKECNEEMYEKMYYGVPGGFARGAGHGDGLLFRGRSLELRATMSPMGRAMLKVEVWDQLFTA